MLESAGKGFVVAGETVLVTSAALGRIAGMRSTVFDHPVWRKLSACRVETHLDAWLFAMGRGWMWMRKTVVLRPTI